MSQAPKTIGNTPRLVQAPAEDDRIIAARMRRVLDAQRAAALRDPAPDAALRRDRLARLLDLLRAGEGALCDAVAEDYGGRSADVTRQTDILGSVMAAEYDRRHLGRLMAPERRRAALGAGLFGARVRIEHQPKGVVGIIAPWNFPLALALMPLSSALAAGNRALVKMSELSPATTEALRRLVAERFDEDEVAIFGGGPDAGAAFCRLPLDHLLFTGSPRVGRLVMSAAAEQLTPVTLELGGKSPVLLGPDADVQRAAARVAWGKTLNAGQVCLAPDYVLLPAGARDAFVAAFLHAVAALFPRIAANPDYTPLHDEGQLARMRAYLDEARARGAQIIAADAAGEGTQGRRLPPTLILDAPDDSRVMQEEIFGPLLPVRTYRDLDEALEYINGRPRPLALYYFGRDEAQARAVLRRTCSGGACVNDVCAQAFQDDAPFGGIGESGMGAYRGEAGFRTFSHARTVYRAPGLDVTAPLRPPYGPRLRRILDLLIHGPRRSLLGN